MMSIEIIFDENSEFCYNLSSLGLESWELVIYNNSIIFSSDNDYIEVPNKQGFIDFLKNQKQNCIIEFEDSKLELNKDQINGLLSIFHVTNY